MSSSPFKYATTLLKRAANQTNVANTWNRVSWDTVVWDDGGWIASTPQLITAPPGATWIRFTWYAAFAAGGTGNRFLSIEEWAQGTQNTGNGIATATYPANNEAGHTLRTNWIRTSVGTPYEFYFQTADASSLLGTDTGRSGSTYLMVEYMGDNGATDSIPPVVDVSSKSAASFVGVSTKTFSLTTEGPNEVAVLAVNTINTGGHVTAVSGGGLTWVQRKDFAFNTSYHVQTWYAVVPTAITAQTITITLGASTNGDYVCAAYKGADTTTPWDSSGSLAATNSGAASAPAGTTTAPLAKPALGIFAAASDGISQNLPSMSAWVSDGDAEISNVGGSGLLTLAHFKDRGNPVQVSGSHAIGQLMMADALLSAGGTPTLDTTATGAPSLVVSTTLSLTTHATNEVVVLVFGGEAYRNRSVGVQPCNQYSKITSVSGGGLTWHRRGFKWSDNGQQKLIAEIWYAVASSIVTAQTITVTWDNPFEDGNIAMYAFSNVDTTTVWDGNGSLPGSNAVPNAGGIVNSTISTTATDTLAIAVAVDGATQIAGPFTDGLGNSFTTLNTLSNFGASLSARMVVGTFHYTSAVGMTAPKLASSNTNWGTITDYLLSNRAVSNAGPTGTWASTEATDAMAFTGHPSLTGTLGPTEAKDVFAGRGGVLTGTWGSTEAKDVLSVTGSTIGGTMGAVETKDHWITPPFGTWGSTEAKDAFASTGYPELTGSMGVTEAADAFHMVGGAIPDITLDSFADAIAVTPPGGPVPSQVQVTLSTTYSDDVIVLMVASGGFWDYHPVSGVSDTAGLTWHRRASRPASYSTTGAKNVEIWWAHAPTPLSADVITVTCTGPTGQLAVNAIAIAGANFSAPWDVHPYANQWNFRNMFGASIETGFTSTHAAKTMTLLMSAGDVAQSAANTGFPFTFLGTVNGEEHNGGNALNVGSAYNINGTALDQSLVQFGPNGQSNFYSDSIVQAGQTGTDQEILFYLDGFFWQIGTGTQIWPNNINIFPGANGTVQCSISTSSVKEVIVAVVSLYSAGGAGQVSSIADSAGLASGWTRRSRKTTVDGTMALEVWYAIAPTTVGGMAITAHTSGTVANDYAQILAFGVVGATYFYDGILWDGDSSLPDEATYTSPTTAIGEVVTGMGTINMNTLDLAFMTHFDVAQAFTPAPAGSAAYPDALGPYANTNAPNDCIGVLFKFSHLPLASDLMASAGSTKKWVTIGDAIPVGPPQPPVGAWGSHEGVDICSAAGFVPAFGTMNPTEATDTTGGAPNIPPFTGVGWLGWVPAFATWASIDSKDHAVAEGWVIGAPLTGVMGPTESKDRAALSNRTTVTGTMGVTESKDRFASSGFEIPKALPAPPRQRRLLIVS